MFHQIMDIDIPHISYCSYQPGKTSRPVAALDEKQGLLLKTITQKSIGRVTLLEIQSK